MSYFFSFSTSLFCPFVVIFDFYLAKVSRARNMANTEENFYWRQSFRDPPKSKITVSWKLCRPIVCLSSSDTHDYTMHIKGSR